jgi:serine/threonine-protein phosphatase PP1 catalytic subunit
MSVLNSEIIVSNNTKNNENTKNSENTKHNESTKNSENFINFINHLLTFNKQMALLQSKNPVENNTPFRFNISARVLIKLCELVKPILQNEPNILEIEAPVNVFGDIHGQFSDMIHFLEMTGLPPNNKFLFMGDYVDRGNNSIEVCALLFAMKIMYPSNIQILRGNHECPEVNCLYGLLTECETRFGNDARLVFNKINEVLCVLPVCAIINNKIFCVHGGISPHLKNLDDIKSLNRFGKIPDSGLLCDLMWSDPSISTSKWGTNNRGISCTYNNLAINTFLKNNKLQLLCRAHQLVSEGYKFFGNNKMITVFSAPNYCGNCGNDGAVMKVNENLVCSFIIIKPTNIK